jgi:hypothetical protein
VNILRANLVSLSGIRRSMFRLPRQAKDARSEGIRCRVSPASQALASLDTLLRDSVILSSNLEARNIHD